MIRNFNIYKKLTLGFGITTLAIIAGSILNYFILEQNISIVRKIANDHAPSSQNLNDLYFEVSNSKMLIKNWVFIEVKSNTPNKQRLKNFHRHRYPKLKMVLKELSASWEQRERKQLNTIFTLIEDSLVPQHRFIMDKLNNFESYDNPMILFETMSMVEQEDDPVMALSDHILQKVDILNTTIGEKYDLARNRMEDSNAQFRKAILIVGLMLMLISIATGLFLSSQIIKPIRKLQKATQEISRGNLDVKVSLNTRDELQALGNNFDIMTENLRLNRRKLQNANDKLRQSQENLKKSNSTKDKFFSIIAHDLRAPFNAFVSVADVMANAPESLSEERRRSFARNIFHSATHLNNLIENLLQWSRSQTNRLDFNPVHTDMKKMLDEAIPVVKTQARNKNITVKNTTVLPVYAQCDPNLIALVVRNLLSNAIKYSPENTTVWLKAEYYDEQHVRISVQDEGIGIEKKDIDKLFRIDVNTKYIGESIEKGTGLGLILCREFIEKHGGNIFVASEVNKGSIFSFTIPKKQP
jgi:signal transduction histidine kinase